MNRIFLDLDGVVADFRKKKEALGLSGDELKKLPGAYLDLDPIDGAIETIHTLIGMGFDVFIATKPPTGIPWAYADKVTWILQHIPELKRKIILTHDKGLLGDEGDILVDDRPHKANCSQFKGTFIPFVNDMNWPKVLEIIRLRIN